MNKRIIGALIAATMSVSLCAQVLAEVDVSVGAGAVSTPNIGASGGGGASAGAAKVDKNVTYGSAAFELSEVFGEKKLVSSDENVLKISEDNKIIASGTGIAYVYAEGEEETQYRIRVDALKVEADTIEVWDKKADGTKTAAIVSKAYAVKNAVNGDDVYVDTTAAAAEFDSAEPGKDIKVTVSGLKLGGADAANYVIDETYESRADIVEEISAENIAASITAVFAPKGAKKLALPSADGYSITIDSSSDESVIAKNGKITAYAADKTVDIVLAVTKIDTAPSVTPASELPLQTTDTAKTAAISVKVFGSSSAEIAVNAEHGTVTGSGTYAMGDEVTLTPAADEDYIFEGWYIGDEFIGRENPYKFTVEHSLELTANFILKNSRKVNIATEYTGIDTNITGGGEYNFGDIVTLSVENEKYFRYWAVNGVKVSEQKNYVFTAVEDVTVTAVMHAVFGGSLNYNYKYCTVSFDTNGGTEMDSIKVARNTVMKEPDEPVRAGYKFNGWYSDEKLTSKYTFRDRVLEDMTLYASWTKAASNSSGNTAASKDVPYTDVSEKDWFYDAVKYMYRNEIMKGMTDKTFEPNTPLTRAMFAAVLYRASGEDISNVKLTFIDVGRDMWYTEAISWAVQNGIAVGYSDKIFAPDDPVTREQMAAMLYHFAKYRGYDMSGSASLSDFSDADDVSDWAIAAVKWAVDKEILSGMSGSILAPKGTATRAQCASMIKRCIDNLDFMKTEE